jgi:hypothetical protein
MKKSFSFVFVVLVLFTMLGMNVGRASAAGTNVLLYIPGVTKEQLKEAGMYVNSTYQHVDCVLKDAATGQVSCHVSDKLGGETALIYIAGQVFTVTVPNTHNSGHGGSSNGLHCDEGEVSGADVLFTTITHDVAGPYFYEGDSLADVNATAAAFVNNSRGHYMQYFILSGLYCSAGG